MLALLLLIAGTAVATAIYYYLQYHATYWERRGIPHPPYSSLFYGNAKQLFSKYRPRMLQYREWGKIYGKTYGTKEGVINCLVTSDPEMLHEILVKQYDNFYSRKNNILWRNPDKEPRTNLFNARGGKWKRLRAISAPSFSVNSLKKIRPVVDDSARNMVRLMEERHGNGEVFNIHKFYCEYTMDTICRLVMGQKGSRIFENPHVETALKVFGRDFDRLPMYLNHAFPFLAHFMSYYSAFMEKIGLPMAKDAICLLQAMEVAVTEKMKKREENPEAGEDSQDFIDLFLDAAVEHLESDKANFKLNESQVTKQLSFQEVVAQAFVFLLAGFDTTANALAYTSWMLANNPEVMKRCQEEIDELCTEETISYEDLNQLKYLEATCKETLRFYPLGSFANSRTCMRTTEVCGLKIEKGTFIQVDTFNLHFDKEVWGEDADEFNPMRWLETDRKVPPHCYIPFGGGPRICIGMRLALMEEKIALSHILRKFNIRKDEKTTDLRILGTLTLNPETVPVRIEPRF